MRKLEAVGLLKHCYKILSPARLWFVDVDVKELPLDICLGFSFISPPLLCFCLVDNQKIIKLISFAVLKEWWGS